MIWKTPIWKLDLWNSNPRTSKLVSIPKILNNMLQRLEKPSKNICKNLIQSLNLITFKIYGLKYLRVTKQQVMDRKNSRNWLWKTLHILNKLKNINFWQTSYTNKLSVSFCRFYALLHIPTLPLSSYFWQIFFGRPM